MEVNALQPLPASTTRVALVAADAPAGARVVHRALWAPLKEHVS